jgi:hypothetical protein
VNTAAKGVKFEREVAATFEQAGFQVRGLEAGGDHFVVTDTHGVMHVEAKRHERVRLPEWLRQQEADCPPQLPRVLVFRQSNRPAYAVVPLAQFVAMLGARDGS